MSAAPLPWYVSNKGTDDADAVCGIASSNGFIVCDLLGSCDADITVHRNTELARANAEFIVRAVNSHETFVAVLRDIDKWAREADGDQRVYCFGFDSGLGVRLRALLLALGAVSDGEFAVDPHAEVPGTRSTREKTS